jgi:hypothetical protein
MQDPGCGPQDAQHQSVARGICRTNALESKGCGECCSRRGCQVRGRRYGAGCCWREERRGAARVARRCISSLETERVKLSRGASTSMRPRGGNCGAVTHPHCGQEVTRRPELKTSRAAAERAAHIHAAAGAAEADETAGYLADKRGCYGSDGLAGGHCRAEGLSERSEAANSPTAVPAGVHHVNAVVGGTQIVVQSFGT